MAFKTKQEKIQTTSANVFCNDIFYIDRTTNGKLNLQRMLLELLIHRAHDSFSIQSYSFKK